MSSSAKRRRPDSNQVKFFQQNESDGTLYYKIPETDLMLHKDNYPLFSFITVFFWTYKTSGRTAYYM